MPISKTIGKNFSNKLWSLMFASCNNSFAIKVEYLFMSSVTSITNFNNVKN